MVSRGGAWSKGAVLGAILLGCLAVSTRVAAAPPPETMPVDGQGLQLAGHGTRNEMLFIELYAVALYLPRDMPRRDMSDAEAIKKPDVPKAVRVEIRYDGSLPDRIPAGWRSELMPVLSSGQQQTLRQHYRRLQASDVITIEYAPRTGTTVAVNGKPIVQDQGDALMNAFLDVWIGRQPVSDDLKQSLL